MTMTPTKEYCPSCGEHTGVPIVWGEPADTPDYENYIYAGCCIMIDPEHPQANMGCTKCGHRWYSFPAGYWNTDEA